MLIDISKLTDGEIYFLFRKWFVIFNKETKWSYTPDKKAYKVLGEFSLKVYGDKKEQPKLREVIVTKKLKYTYRKFLEQSLGSYKAKAICFSGSWREDDFDNYIKNVRYSWDVSYWGYFIENNLSLFPKFEQYLKNKDWKQEYQKQQEKKREKKDKRLKSKVLDFNLHENEMIAEEIWHVICKKNKALAYFLQLAMTRVKYDYKKARHAKYKDRTSPDELDKTGRKILEGIDGVIEVDELLNELSNNKHEAVRRFATIFSDNCKMSGLTDENKKVREAAKQCVQRKQ